VFRSLVLTALGAGLLVVAAPGRAPAGGKSYPRLHQALHELREARRELKDAGDRFGGHRVKALKATDAAIGEIEECLRAAGDNTKGIAFRPDVYRQYKSNPHIHHAIKQMEEARTVLRNAPKNFGGHREAAIREIDRAVQELRACLRFARP
jgi:hypothetical protein